MMMANGFGAFFGSILSGFRSIAFLWSKASFDWTGIWLSFATYAAIVAVLFWFCSREPQETVTQAIVADA